jgi:hypothetical protein
MVLETELPSAVSKSMYSTPQTQTPGRYPACLLRAPAGPYRRDKTAHTAASTGRRSGHFGTLEGATGGTQTHSRRTGERLGRLQRARQELVRVSESNTKYGGKRGKPGGAARACCPQVSVSPQGFPREKICDRSAPSGFTPLFTGEVFLWASTCIAETHVRVRRFPVRNHS